MAQALTILAVGIVTVALVLALRCPKELIPELARALARWLGSSDKPSMSEPHMPPMGILQAPAIQGNRVPTGGYATQPDAQPPNSLRASEESSEAGLSSIK
jgi:hypothetical protein